MLGAGAEVVGVAVSGVGGAVLSVSADTGVLCREEERRSRLPDFEAAPFLPAVGGMVKKMVG